jgi:peptidoglycan/xylan/chitin deacetylase (PgdA/CDA1 family)
MNFICLTYHRVTADPAAQSDPYTVIPADLEAQLSWLARQGYRGISVSQAVADRSGKRQLAFAFDDGYQDFYTTAWPLLRRYGFGATLFLVVGRVGQAADWPEAPGVPLVSWTEVRELAAQGVEVAMHGVDHRAMDAVDTATLQTELQAARQIVAAETGIEPVGLAYPYGRYTPFVLQVAQTAGFAWAATARGGRNVGAANRFALRRTLIKGAAGSGWTFALKVRTGYAKLVEWRMDLRRIQ